MLPGWRRPVSSLGDPSERDEGAFDIDEFWSCCHSATKGLLCRLLEQVGWPGGLREVVEGARHGGDRDGTYPSSFFWGDRSVMQDHPFWHPKATSFPFTGERHVHLGRECVGEVVQRQRRPVREHAGLVGPEPDGDQLLVLTGWEVDDSIDAAPYALESTCPNVVNQELGRVVGFGSLLSREESFLGCCGLAEVIPVRCSGIVGLAQNLSMALGYCKSIAHL